MSEMLLVEKKGHVLTLTLNNPARLNSLSGDMIPSLGKAFREAGEDPDVRVIVMLAEGRGFCSGADAGGLGNAAGNLAGTTTRPEDVQMPPMPKFTARHIGIFKPTICAVNGICAGAGLHFVADSEIVIASTEATFTDTHVNIGQVTALEPIGLSRRMPLGEVLRMVALGKAQRLTAQRAYELGMVSEVVEPERLRARAYELADIVASVSPESLQKSLQSIWRSLEMPLAQGYEEGYETLVRHRLHPDALEGPKAFMGKRDPVWSPPFAWTYNPDHHH